MVTRGESRYLAGSLEALRQNPRICTSEAAVEYLPVQGDALAAHFVVVLRRLFTVASRVNSTGEGGSNLSGRSVTAYGAREIGNGGRNDISGKQELALLEAGELDPSVGLDFSRWVDL